MLSSRSLQLDGGGSSSGSGNQRAIAGGNKTSSDAVVFFRFHIGHFVENCEKAFAVASRGPLPERCAQRLGRRERLAR